jgi:hypothetical protein
MALVMSADPVCFEEVVKNENWRLAMDCEINSIEKYNEHGDIDKHKARLVTKGYSQKHGIDYTEVFALVARLDMVRMIIALAVQKSWKIF